MPGTGTSTTEVTNISRHGFWLLLDGRELFVSFEDFPWFKQATVDAILSLERPSTGSSALARPRRRLGRRLDRAPRAIPAQVQGAERVSRPG